MDRENIHQIWKHHRQAKSFGDAQDFMNFDA